MINDDGISLIAAQHPTNWWLRIKHFFVRPRIRADSIVTVETEIDRERLAKTGGLRILKRP